MTHKFCEAPTLPQVLVKVNHEILKKKSSAKEIFSIGLQVIYSFRQASEGEA